MYCIQVLQTIEGEQKHLFRRKSGGALNGKFVTTPTSDSVRATEPIFQSPSNNLVFKQNCYLYQSFDLHNEAGKVLLRDVLRAIEATT